MADKRCTQHRNNIILILIFIFFTVLALGAGLVALFTDSWVTYEVKTDNRTAVYNASVDSSMLYHTRSRGLFYIVIKNPNVKLVKSRGNDARFPVQYNHNNTCGRKVSVGFWDLSAMMKASVSLHLLYLVIVAVSAWLAGFAMIFGIINLKLSVIVLFLGEIAGIIGMALFHYYLMFEKSNDVPEMADTIYYFWNEFLKTNTTEYFSYSLMLQWISIGITLVTIVLGVLFITTWTTTKHKPIHKQPQQQPINYVNAHDNYAYDKEDFQRGNQRAIDYRPSPKPERREPTPPAPATNPVRRSWANGIDYDRRPADETRFEYRELPREDRRDQGRDFSRGDNGNRSQYPPADQTFYQRY